MPRPCYIAGLSDQLLSLLLSFFPVSERLWLRCVCRRLRDADAFASSYAPNLVMPDPWEDALTNLCWTDGIPSTMRASMFSHLVTKATVYNITQMLDVCRGCRNLRELTVLGDPFLVGKYRGQASPLPLNIERFPALRLDVITVNTASLACFDLINSPRKVCYVHDSETGHRQFSTPRPDQEFELTIRKKGDCVVWRKLLPCLTVLRFEVECDFWRTFGEWREIAGFVMERTESHLMPMLKRLEVDPAVGQFREAAELLLFLPPGQRVTCNFPAGKTLWDYHGPLRITDGD